MTLTLRNSRINTPGPVGLPPGTEIGDALLVLGFADPFTVDDARLTWHEPHTFQDSSGGFWIGTATTLDPVTAAGAKGTGIRSFSGLVLTFAGRTVLSRLSIVHPGDAAIHSVPGITGRGSGAIMLSIGWAGIGGLGTHEVTGGGASWDPGFEEADYHGAAVSWTEARTIDGSVTVAWDSTVAPLSFASMLVGATTGRVVTARRRFPRSDGRGRGPRRIFPPENVRTRGRHGPNTTI